MKPDTNRELGGLAKTTGLIVAGAALVGGLTYVSLPVAPVAPYIERQWTNGVWAMPYGWPDKYPQSTTLEASEDLQHWTVVTNFPVTRTNNVHRVRIYTTNAARYFRTFDHYD